MTIFIELITDAFEEVLNGQTSLRKQFGRSSRAGSRVARRPTRGIEIKEDTYATIKVILSDGSELPLVDSSSATGRSSGYSNFMLQSVTEVRMEKHQIVETFGAAYIYFFGENPRFLDVQATIINSHDFNWEAEWWENYEQNFRGTRLVEKGGRMYMFYDDNIVEGYMLMCQATKQSAEPHLIPISFRLFLTNYRNVSFIGSPQFPIHQNAVVTSGVDVTSGQRGQRRNEATLNAVPDRGSALTRAASNGSFATAPRLSELLRDASATGAIDPATQLVLSQLGQEVPVGRALPLRSLIADNYDEYVGLSANDIGQGGLTAETGQTGMSPADQQRMEVDDLNQETVSQLGEHGADVNDPKTLSDLGLMPNFETDARAPATFRPKEKGSFGFDTGKEDVGNDASGDFLQFRADPLGAVFGGAVTKDRELDNRFTEGAGDSKYGFRSEFAVGAGFGQAGFGDLGGPGFGSGQGAAGDPGFKNPSQLTFSGATSQKAAFNKFKKPKPDQSAFGAGAGIGSSSSGVSGGAAIRVGGKPSPFSIISVGGTLKL